MRWMLDTNVCIALIKGAPERALRRLRSRPIGQVGISSVTLAELEFGVARSQRSADAAAALLEFLLPIGALDTLIAGHALAIDAVLVTNNAREFGRVASLRIENWLA